MLFPLLLSLPQVIVLNISAKILLIYNRKGRGDNYCLPMYQSLINRDVFIYRLCLKAVLHVF